MSDFLVDLSFSTRGHRCHDVEILLSILNSGQCSLVYKIPKTLLKQHLLCNCS